MAKILLVEDDNNLREIYEARLQAEGYDIVSAKDGEEALVVAKKERPDLIVADVMMPRVSGFEMLDILRNTPELKDVHVIMLTALGQAEDKTRADSLGADRYLVKSQVTLEDIVKAAADVLAGAPTATPAMTTAADGVQGTAPTPAPAAPEPTTAAIPVAAAPAVPADTTTPAPASPPQNLPTPQIQTPAPSISIPAAVPPVVDMPVAPASAPADQTQGAFAVSAPSAAPAVPATATNTTSAAAIPEPSATDSQLVTAAVNNLTAGAAGLQNTSSPAPAMPPAQPAAATSPPATPAPALTMEPVITPPVAPAPTPAPAAPVQKDVTTINDIPPNARKAIQPLPPGTVPGQSDLNELMAKEGHTLDNNKDVPPIFSGSHMPGNVITPGAANAPNQPSGQAPTDPNSISL